VNRRRPDRSASPTFSEVVVAGPEAEAEVAAFRRDLFLK
jgi:hypothetical protein